MNTELKKGSVVRFDYPAANFACVRRPRLEPRRLRIERIRNVEEEPLDPVTLELEPARLRGTVLLSGLDLDKGESRSFWLESMQNVEPIEWDEGPQEVVLLDNDGSDPEVVYRAESTAIALQWAAGWLNNPMGLTVGIRRAS
jgi:hypothetical protein